MSRNRKPFNAKSLPIVNGVLRVFKEWEPPLTVRQVYYQLSTKLRLVPFSKKGYDQTEYITLRMRKLGMIQWGWFADRTRKVDVVSTWSGLADFAETVKDAYRRDLWEKQETRIEIWLEKDAMAGFFKSALGPYRVGLYTIRGFSSKTFIHEAAQFIKSADKPTHIYYFGDHDPSGLDIEDDVKESLAEFGGNVAGFTRVAITLPMAEQHGVPLLDVKRSDSRAKKYIAKHGTKTAELDGMPPDVLRKLITDCIDKHIDADEWARLVRVEELERESIERFALSWQGE